MKIKINKKALTIMLGTTLILTPSTVLGELQDSNAIVSATTTVNIRLDDTTESQKIGYININESAERILSYDNGWDLIRYNGKIGYIYSKYLVVQENQNPHYSHVEENDIVYTTVNLNFRLDPNTESKKIELIPKGEELIVVAKTNNDWYLVKYNGKIGYVKSQYTKSLKEEILALYPDITKIEIEKIAYAKTNLNLRTQPNTKSEITTIIDKYESFRILEEKDNWCLIKINNLIGYVNKNYIKELEGTYITIDISDQKIVLYKNNDVLVTSNITTGKNSTPTNIGLFKIYNKERSRYLIGEDYKSYVEYWMPFDGGIGLHDASWRNKFGGEIYKKNGSHGCVNLPPEVAQTIYENVKIGTKVLVHK